MSSASIMPRLSLARPMRVFRNRVTDTDRCRHGGNDTQGSHCKDDAIKETDGMTQELGSNPFSEESNQGTKVRQYVIGNIVPRHSGWCGIST